MVEIAYGPRKGSNGDASDPVFVPLGEDSWCYRWGPWWISVRRDRQGHFPAAYRAAADHRAAGYDFALAPVVGFDGEVTHVVDGHPVVVYPYVDGMSVECGAPLRPGESDDIVAMIRRLQGSQVPADVPVEDYRFPFDDELTEQLRTAAARDPASGPYSASLHRRIRTNLAALNELRAEAEALARLCSRDRRAVLSHGEPSAANVLRHDGRLLLLDWTALAWGPPERDWFHVRRSLGVEVTARPEFLRFYELRWILGEIAEYTARFVEPHTGDDDDHAMWRRLQLYLPRKVDR